MKKYYDTLKTSEEFRVVYATHRSKADRYLVMYVAENILGLNRLGISVSKKVGNSVKRHRLTRLVREAFREHQDDFLNGYDIVVVLRKASNPDKDSGKKPLSYQDIENSLLRLGKAQHIIKHDV